MKRNHHIALRKTMVATALTLCVAGMAARQPERGYRGFLEWGNELRSEDWGMPEWHTTLYYTGGSTSHGYQINPWIYVGAGLAMEKCTKYDQWLLPVFVHGRTDLELGRYTPFGEVRLGYNLTDGGGVYFAPAVGYRFNWGRKMGVNIGAGLTVQGYREHVYDIIDIGNGYTIMDEVGTRHRCNAYFTLRLGIDF